MDWKTAWVLNNCRFAQSASPDDIAKELSAMDPKTFKKFMEFAKKLAPVVPLTKHYPWVDELYRDDPEGLARLRRKEDEKIRQELAAWNFADITPNKQRELLDSFKQQQPGHVHEPDMSDVPRKIPWELRPLYKHKRKPLMRYHGPFNR